MRVAVVGGGPAGLTAAKTAADNGLEVTLFEHYRIGERINCGEGFFDILGLCGKPGAGVLFKVQQVLLKVNKLYRIDSTELNLWMIDRASWQRYLAEEACTSGVKILEETPIRIQDMKLLQQDFDWVIDASGVSSISLKAVNNTGENRNRAALTIQCRLEGDFSSLKNSLKAVLEPHYQGYYWIFPKKASKRGIANVGIGFFNYPSAKIDLRRELFRVLQQENLQNCPILEYRGGKIPLNRVSPFMRGNTLLVGDAAGLASSLYGGGLDMAVVSGRLAALSLAQGKPHAYEQLFWKKVKRKAIIEEKIFNLWEQKGINFMETLFRNPVNFLIPSLFSLMSV
ncbi:MAG: NAD(P)/FAD-dependent oxidoreductase [Firmicutes bacterium]|nr:NAD(P)/FAD-dependent oxidoreductase [Bacillota bacterium]